MAWKFDHERSIYIQIMEEIQHRIIAGVYEPGSKMPSVRELAGEAEVNPNTMQKALTELERENILYSQRTSGRFVTEDQERIQSMKMQSAKEAARTFLKQMEGLGLEEHEIIQLIQKIREDGLNE